ncbi:hypothetical protein AWB74_01493 [Caballeronia arvi]|uniref:Uncharacterized protein n=1 Tax=Caballeronia arvi TaxID=1777135 RepID=A0A158H0D5_9BURK|nr:hypothetical protein [Caballeronia arvi]SAL37778.1 hypothetical protein AWB74_01493 [Caballeronia arvi]
MRAKSCLLSSLALMALPCVALAESVSVSSNNSTLKVTRDDPIYNLSTPSDPVQLLRTLEWTVDGRRILVYPSGPSTFLDIGHMHSDAHVSANQIHVQGPMLGYATSASSGTVVGGVVYAVEGDASGTLVSRLTEKVDILNKGTSAVSLSLAGLGFKPTQSSLEVPDYSGLDVIGTTVTVIVNGPITETPPPFGQVSVLPVVSFAGFNPLFNQSVSLPAGSTLSMITELKVSPTASKIQQFLRERAPERFQDSPYLNSPFIRLP